MDPGYLSVERPILQIDGTVTEGKPKIRAGQRKIWLDAGTVALLRGHRRAQLAARMRAGAARQDGGLIFCRDDGSPWRPDYVSRRFKTIAAAAGLPVIKLHEGRHSAASLARDAGVDRNIRQAQLGHATGTMTDHYTHWAAHIMPTRQGILMTVRPEASAWTSLMKPSGQARTGRRPRAHRLFVLRSRDCAELTAGSPPD